VEIRPDRCRSPIGIGGVHFDDGTRNTCRWIESKDENAKTLRVYNLAILRAGRHGHVLHIKKVSNSGE
jgi:hypothetical protein